MAKKTNKDLSFQEITVSDGFAEFMVHLDREGNPLDFYVYRKDIEKIPDYGYYVEEGDSDTAEDRMEHEIHRMKNYRDGINPVFVHSKSKQFTKKAWELYLSKWADHEDIKTW